MDHNTSIVGVVVLFYHLLLYGLKSDARTPNRAHPFRGELGDPFLAVKIKKSAPGYTCEENQVRLIKVVTIVASKNWQRCKI